MLRVQEAPNDLDALDREFLALRHFEGEGQGECYLPVASGLMVMSYLGRVLDRSKRAS